MIQYFLNPFSIIIYLYHKIFNLLKLVKELKKNILPYSACDFFSSHVAKS